MFNKTLKKKEDFNNKVIVECKRKSLKMHIKYGLDFQS